MIVTIPYLKTVIHLEEAHDDTRVRERAASPFNLCEYLLR